MGIVNTDTRVKVVATFIGQAPLPGKVAFVTQSGALGGAIIQYSCRSNVGISKFISLGNKADVSSNDMLAYLEDDDETDTIAMYVESIGNPQKFVEVARRLTRKKPVIVLKSGRTAVGARAVISHTGALAGLDVAYDALFEQCGVIRADTVEAMFDMIKVFTEQPRPTNEDVVVLTNGGGPGILAADALVSKGLKLPEISKKSKHQLSKFIVSEASLSNPVDMTGNATPKDFGKAFEILCRNEKAHSILGMFMPIGSTTFHEALQEVARVKRNCPNKLIMACSVWGEKEEDLRIMREAEVPLFTYPESVGIALAALHKYLKYQKLPTGVIPHFKVDVYKVAKLFESVRKENRRTLTIDESLKVIEYYGIPVAPYQIVKGENGLPEAASKVGYPLVMKLISKDVIHKTELGGVILDIRNENELLKAYNTIIKRAKTHNVEGVLIQKHIKGGKETIIGVAQDPNFGPLIMFGLGGIYVEVLKDVAFRLHPLTDTDAKEMIRSVRSYPLLEGVRGQQCSDIATIENTLLRVSKLISDFHEIVELDINPFILGTTDTSSFAVDARIMLR
jgi:acyl-CoA synthetase (NDP forming)